MAKPKVSASHSCVDDAFAEPPARDLDTAGAGAWLDKEWLEAGEFQMAAMGAIHDVALVFRLLQFTPTPVGTAIN